MWPSLPWARAFEKEHGWEKRWARHRFATALSAILLFSAGLRLYQIDGFSGNYDEGAHLMVAWLLSKGYPLYTEVASAQLPFLYQPTAWLFAVGGPSSVLARWLEVGYALLGIVAVADIGRLLWRPATGLMAALFLSLEIYYFSNSRVFVGSVAAAATGGLAVLCALYYQITGRRKWLFLAGAVFSFSLFIKPLSLSIGLLLLWAVIARHLRGAAATTIEHGTRPRAFLWRKMLADCLCLGMAMLLLPVLCFIFYDGGAMVDRIIGCRLADKLNSTRDSAYVAEILTNYVRTNLSLLLLAAVGAIAMVWRRNRSGLWVIVWLGLSLALLTAERAHAHHLVILDFPLALLAAYPLGNLGAPENGRGSRFGPWRSIATILCLAYWLGGQVLTWPGYFSVAPRGLGRQDDSDRWAAVRLLQHVTTPAQFIVSDDLSIPFEARRTIMPQLADASSGSIRCGLLTQEIVMQWADRKGSAVIFWTNRFLDEFSLLPLWTDVAYAERKQFSEEHIVYYDKRIPQIVHPLNVTFGNVIALDGYELSVGAQPQVTLFWRKLSADAVDYKMTLRLLNAEGAIVAQRDESPYHGFYPTSAWPIGVVLPETVKSPPMNALPPGKYSLAVGLYDPQTLQLLPVEGAIDEHHNLVLLEGLEASR